MSAVTHVLDTSAILAHYFDEPGAQIVANLWDEPGNRVGICVLTLPELRARLEAEIDDQEEIERAFKEYVSDLAAALVVDRTAAERAMLLRRHAAQRLPLTDAIIAGCAHAHAAVLVHRDRHMASIPQQSLAQIVLPAHSAAP